MELSLKTFLIVCPLLFLAGFVDSIGGGGGLISVPAFLLAGLPPHAAVATNKLGAFGGLVLSTGRFVKNKCVSFRLAVPTVIAAIVGSWLGAKLSLQVSETVLNYILFAILPIAAILVLNKKSFHDSGKDSVNLDKKTMLVAVVAAFFVGGYDGFYGPGTGTFLIIAFTALAGLSMNMANGHSKVINLASNITSLVTYLWYGQVLIPVGIAACLCNMLGGYIGSGLALKNGAKIVRPIVLLVLVLLALKVFGVF